MLKKQTNKCIIQASVDYKCLWISLLNKKGTESVLAYKNTDLFVLYRLQLNRTACIAGVTRIG